VDWSGVLSRGETGLILCIGMDQRQAAIQRDYIAGAFDASPLLSSLVVNRTQDTIELSNGVSIEVRAASFRRLRGVTSLAIIASEVAFWGDETTANADVEILGALRPTLATTNGPLLMISSPYSRRGVLWETYRQHYGAKGDPLILVAQGTSRDFNPTLPQRVVDRALERDYAKNSAEYLAIFRTDVESFVSHEVVEAAVVPERRELPPARGYAYAAFVDPSGGSSDSFTLGIAHNDQGKIVLDAIRERKPPFSPDNVCHEYAALLQSYGIGVVQADKYAGEWVIEAFQKVGIRCEQSAAPKSDLYQNLLPLLNAGRVELLDDRRLIAQLCNLERRTARGGRDSIDHAPGQHDDIANGVAGAVVAAGHPRGVHISADLMQTLLNMAPTRHLTAADHARNQAMLATIARMRKKKIA
jgi:hypothetical protein